MTPEQIKFLNHIAAELQTQPGFNDVEQLFFPHRFDKTLETSFEHKEIAEKLMRAENSKLSVDFYSKSIGTTVQNIVSAMVGRLEKKCVSKKTGEETLKKPIKGLYEEEMRIDGVDVDSLLNKKQGERGNWKVLYHWLWNHKYPRWLKASSWELLQEKAVSLSNWLQFLTNEEMESVQRGTRGLILPPPPPSAQKVTPKIPKNQSLWMVIDLNLPNYQLLLFTRSEQEECLLCPSSAYAPNSIIEKPPILLPQKGSWADQDEKKQNFMFEEVGTEEFLAIVVEKPFSLPWLTPCEQEVLPELNAARICELFEQLGQQENWQVFYQSFEVVKQL